MFRKVSKVSNSPVYLRKCESYSTADIAAALGRTSQAVTKAIRDSGIAQPCSKRAGYRLSAEQVTAIAEIFDVQVEFEELESEDKGQAVPDSDSEMTRSLVETLQAQLGQKDAQIAELNQRLEQALKQNAELTNLLTSLTDANKALSAATAAKSLTVNRDSLALQQPKRGFFKRLFGK